ncbi:MAG: amidohydrolase [Alphaproteobacteria bacterium]|nr:amidohydrolase [Alphaproteobacteria bacterium]
MQVENGKVWLEGAKALLPETVTLRRKIHEHPELGLHLPKTVAAVREALSGLDVKIETGPSTSGMIVTLQGPTQGRTVLLRGDMDALPMPEDTDVPFKSKEPGRMHACGHDSHTAMLTGAVKLLHKNRARLAGTVKFMFQPGEEGYFGARHMIDDGLIDRHPKPDGAFAMHITPNVPTGIFTAKAGAFMASTDTLEVRVIGKGGHASAPHHTVDPMPVACEIVLALQSFVTRKINAFDPVVLTIAKIDGGTTSNVIPESVSLLGTLRSVSEGSRARAKEGLKKVIEKIAEAHDARAEVKLTPGYDVTVNDGRMVDLAAAAARDLFGDRGFMPMPAPVMGAEDWSYVLQRIPGCMVFLGVAPEGCNHHHAAPCHSNRMMLDEDAMANGVALYAAVAERFLEQGLAAKG